MRKDFADSFSLSFHPILIPFYTLLFVFALPIFQVQALGMRMQISLLIIAGLSTVILPILSMYFLKRKGIISSFKMPIKEERTIPYLYTIVYFSITAFMLQRIEIIPIIIPMIFAIPAIIIAIVAALNAFLKVSAHAAGMGGLLSMLILVQNHYIIDLLIPIIISLVLSTIVILSRKYLKAHSWLELAIGYLLSIAITMIVGLSIL